MNTFVATFRRRLSALGRHGWRLARVGQFAAAAAFLLGGLLGHGLGDRIAVAGFFVLLVATLISWPSLTAATTAVDPDDMPRFTKELR